MLLHMLGYALATGNNIFGKEIEKRGNVLIIAAEETQNEQDIRLAACKQQMGKNDGKFKIFKLGLEQDLKLVKFTQQLHNKQNNINSWKTQSETNKLNI